MRLVTAALAVLVLTGVGSDVRADAARQAAARVSEHRASVTDGKIVTPGFAMGFVGVLWDGAARGGKVRFRTHDRWTAWQPLRQDEIEVRGRFASTLMSARGATAYQVRLPKLARRARAVAMNTALAGSTARATAATGVILRGPDGWQADESLRFDAQGNEIWPPAYYDVQTITVHHTATRNGDPDPAATMRAIYRYHAIDQGWGDIGYQYLIDEQGRVYEGRYSGDDGDPAHDASGAMVTAAHVGGWNSGNLGIALLGTLRTKQPTAAARAALEKLLAELAGRHALDPQARTLYVNPVSSATRDVDVISGHRDWESTECPGTTFYKQLPSVRANVAGLLAPAPTGTVHVTDLEGSSSSQGRTWTAEVTVTVADGDSAVAKGVTVTGTWTSGASSTCTTDAGGSCVVRLDRLRNNVSSTTLTVAALAAAGLTYAPLQNSDADGDSTGSAIVVRQP